MNAHFGLLALSAALLLGGCVGPAAGQGAITAAQRGDAALGLSYARQVCSECHAVEARETISPDPAAPSFGELANSPGMTGLALTVWLNSAHEQMPHFIVDPDHVDDLSAYLHALKQQQRAPRSP